MTKLNDMRKSLARAIERSLACLTRQNILALLLVAHAFALSLRPETGVMLYMNQYYQIQPMPYALLFVLAGAFLLARRVTAPQLVIALSPLIMHCAATWYYVLITPTSPLTPALSYTAICAIGIHHALKDPENA